MDVDSDDQVKAVLQLLEKAEAILWEEKGEDKTTARRFNVFCALRVERSELPHSRFLACLLDPQGIHDQKDLFLRAFLEDVLQEQIERLVNLTKSKVATELSTEYGNLDIVITLSDKQIIVIENKVDAGEGEDQLKRYQSWLNKQPGGPHRLVFLTPDGRAPFSCDPADVKKVKRVSYEMIADWLDKLRDMVPVPLEVVLSQYTNLWRSIPMNEKLLELLRDPRNFGTAVDILEAAKQVSEEARQQFLIRIQEVISSKLHQSKFSADWNVPMPIMPRYGTLANVGLKWSKGRKDGKGHFSVLCEAQDKNWDQIIIGICRGAGVQEDNRIPLDKKMSLSMKTDQKVQQSKWWTGFVDLRDLIGVRTVMATDLLSDGYRISKVVADKLWVLFESYRTDLEDLNRNYPYPCETRCSQEELDSWT